ncbi:MAG: F0F1 ATP synthase subunit A [Alphaproteobacteria bacterium]|nr:F0F1 ATP synthase subunit A [Alphaproteobacteria bacterium]
MIDPLHQFEIHKLIPFEIGGIDLSFTNASLFMVLTTCVICLVAHFATQSAIATNTLVPARTASGRTQIGLEMLFCFVGSMVKSHVGKEGRAYFPYIFSLFLFVLGGNLIGLLPYSFTFTSHIIVTFTLAMIVFVGATIAGIVKHGWGFFKIFLPDGIPLYVAPLLVPVEIISYLSRPVSLSVRLFANMVAGHVMLKIFAGFAILLASGLFLPVAILPIVVNTAVTAFELLIAVLQAYVFTILACIYLNDALNLH